MSKTILAEVDGWTPLIDTVTQELGLVSSAVFGRIWRFCQGERGVCVASLDRIADDLGINRATVQRHAKRLVDSGYLKDLTPGLIKKPHTYADTGKARIGISVSVAHSNNSKNQSVADNNSSVADNNSSVADNNRTVAESSLKKEEERIKKEVKKGRAQASLFPIAKALSEVTGMDFEKNRGRLFREAKGYTEANLPQLLADYGESGRWYSCDWRGMRGEKPTLSQIKETWNNLTKLSARIGKSEPAGFAAIRSVMEKENENAVVP